MMFIFSFLCSVCFFHIVQGEERIILNSGWVVSNANNSIQTNGQVPGGIYTDLNRAGILQGDFFYRFNDLEFRWVAYDNWTYQTSFQLTTEALSKTSINLVFHGLDTVGTVYLNGKLLATFNNMFIRYVLPIKDIVQEKHNILKVVFVSPVAEALRLYEQQSLNYTVPPKCVPAAYHGECHVNFLRKMQASFSWDWGPAFPSVGIWKPVEIEAFDSAVIRDVTVTTTPVTDGAWEVNATVYIESATDELVEHVITGSLKTNPVQEATVLDVKKDPFKSNSFIAVLQFNAEGDSWWPNGFGRQPLYPMTVTFGTKREQCNTTINIGLRTVELVQEELVPDQKGRSFYFKVNGIPFFAKGSNWIPGHVLPELGGQESIIRHALTSAKEAHMNMLRVWGGGVYESDLFYQLADELGIFIWQDMMFACSMYPTNTDFLESVKTEIEQQTRRLHHHPSIAVWAGNNENEAALRQNWYGTGPDFETYKADYIKLYVETVQAVNEANDKTRSYAISSPSNGVDTIREGYVANNPYSALFGDVHYYNYISDAWNPLQYPDTRFASEYGFQAMPSFRSFSKVSLPEDWKLTSGFSQQRQHHSLGYAEMTQLIKRHLPLPSNDNSEAYYQTFIYYSQITQAMGIKTETEKYRRDRSKLTSLNEGNTMGALYWQLNDVWQAPTWASIEFEGRWKMLHYYAKKFFSPVLISPMLTADGQVKVFLISDLLEEVPQVELNLTIYSWDSFVPRKTLRWINELPNATSTEFVTLNLSTLLTDTQCKVNTCVLYFSLSGSDIFSNNIIYPSPLKNVNNLQPATINVNITANNDQTLLLIQLRTDLIAPFLWLETDEPGQFSDNGFTLITSTVQIKFCNRNLPVDLNHFKNSLTVQSLLTPVAKTRNQSQIYTVYLI